MKFCDEKLFGKSIIFESIFIYFINLLMVYWVEVSKSNVEFLVEIVYGVISGWLFWICRELLSSNFLVMLKFSLIDSLLEL